MAEYKTISDKLKASTTSKAPSEASAAPEAPWYISELSNPPQLELDQELIDHETGEAVKISSTGARSQSLVAKMTLRYKRQTQARKALYAFSEDTVYKPNGHEKHHRTCYCNHVPYSKEVDVLRNPSTDRFHLSGLATCASAATCPVCESIISERRANELRSAFNQAKAQGWYIQLLTFTIPHTVSDDIEILRPALSAAQQGFFNGSPWKKKVAQYGIKAYARSLECRLGSNGWHPHFHFIVFSEKPLPPTKLQDSKPTSKRFRKLDLSAQSSDWLWWLERWQNMCVKNGLSSPNEYGLDIRDGSQAYDYIVKYGQDGEHLTTNSHSKKVLTWDMADEITKGNKKDGKESLSPFQLLDILSDSGRSQTEKQRARIQFIKYARAMKGVPLMRWSKSAFDVFCFDERNDVELLKDESDVSVLLTQLTVRQWKCILKYASRDQFMEVVNSGCGLPGIKAFVDSCTSQDDSSFMLIDEPVNESELLQNDFTDSEQLEMFDNKLAVLASFDDYDNSASELSATIHNGEFLDEITRSLVSRKLKVSPELRASGKRLESAKRKKSLESMFDDASDKQKQFAIAIEEQRAMRRLLASSKKSFFGGSDNEI